MNRPSNNPNEWGTFGPDPGPGIRVMVALLLRFGIGLTLLNTGLAGYMNVRMPMPGMSTSIANVSSAGLDPLLSALPYLSMGLGLALILGFLTTPTSIAAAFFGLLTPLMSTVGIISSGMPGSGGMMGPGRFGGDPFGYMTMVMGTTGYLPGLIPQVFLIWLSPLENHPYSVDALIFGRGAVAFTPPAAPTPGPAAPEEPAPGPA